MATKAKTTTTVTVRPPKIEKVFVNIKSTSPLLMHAWSDAAKAKMRETQSGNKVKAKKEARDPLAEFEGAKYEDERGLYIPAIALKKAMIRACKNVEGVDMVDAKQLFFVRGIYSHDKIHLSAHSEPLCREDMVRVGNGSSDFRYRPEIQEWKATLEISFVENIFSINDVYSVITWAGSTVGVCDNRPEKSGNSFGMFEIDA